MSDGRYEINVYSTAQLRDYCNDKYGNKNEAAERACTYIEAAFNRGSNPHEVSVDYIDQRVDAPTQEWGGGSFTTPRPCRQDLEVTYSSLLHWWRDWIDCDNGPEAPDSNILLTDTDESDGGKAYISGNKAFTQTGRLVAELPSNPDEWGSDLKHSAMHTVLHEIGHNFTRSGLASDNSELYDPVHQMGDDYSHVLTTTHSALSDPGRDNVCGNYVDSNASGDWELRWDDCCVKNWRGDN